ncbi:hypothetical protein IV203_035820 [Nitzschia inconspicua]|uniref:Uncharacterized protein n=1 Tax=Nitzschia inconspicua TaxID=303405 RepID=A0A9K3LGX9_9STRA|nr:hypothetical protein IV203_035820 [Nitzschia inconspicua]
MSLLLLVSVNGSRCTTVKTSPIKSESKAMNLAAAKEVLMHPVAKKQETVTPRKATTNQPVKLVSIKAIAANEPVIKQGETHTRERLDDTGCTHPTLKCGICTHLHDEVLLCIGDDVYNRGLCHPEVWWETPYIATFAQLLGNAGNTLLRLE